MADVGILLVPVTVYCRVFLLRLCSVWEGGEGRGRGSDPPLSRPLQGMGGGVSVGGGEGGEGCRGPPGPRRRAPRSHPPLSQPLQCVRGGKRMCGCVEEGGGRNGWVGGWVGGRAVEGADVNITGTERPPHAIATRGAEVPPLPGRIFPPHLPSAQPACPPGCASCRPRSTCVQTPLPCCRPAGLGRALRRGCAGQGEKGS